MSPGRRAPVLGRQEEVAVLPNKAEQGWERQRRWYHTQPFRGVGSSTMEKGSGDTQKHMEKKGKMDSPASGSDQKKGVLIPAVGVNAWLSAKAPEQNGR